jgi:protein TonB
MLQRLLTLYRNQAQLAWDRERAFLDLLHRVLRELANPAAPTALATRIQQQSFANHSATFERSFTMKVTPVHRSMFTPLDASGGRGMSRTSLGVAILLNVAIMLLLGIQVRQRVILDRRPARAMLIAPVEKLPEPPAPKGLPKIVPPRPLPVREEAPKIVRTAAVAVEAPAPMKMVEPRTLPAVAPAMARVEVLPVTPKPQIVRMQTSAVPIQPVGPAVATVNLRTASASASAAGSAISDVRLGSRNATSGSAGVATATTVTIGGCTANCGSSRGNAPPARLEPISLARPLRTTPLTVVAEHRVTRTPPQVLYKPRPAYTEDATALHIEGVVTVKIRVAADGGVTVLGVQSGLGHGLDESAVRCAQGIRFKPALDASGAATDWEGVVTISFRMA